MMTQERIDEKQKNSQLRFPVDPVHGGLRVAVMGTFVGGGILGFLGTLALVPGGVVLALGGAVAAAAGGSYSVEQYLKRKWPSGRELVADHERIALTKNDKMEAVVDGQKQVNALGWYFKVKKDSPRARKGHYVVALSLEQDDTHVIVYSVASPDEFEEMPASGSFQHMVREKDKGKQKDVTRSGSAMRRAGEERRVYEAEVVRQIMGGDIAYPQFVQYINFLQANFPQWMLS